MTRLISNTIRFLLRTAILWIVDALSLAGASFLLPGLTVYAVGTTPAWAVVVAAAMLLAVVNLLIRPIVLLLARPLGWIAMFIVGYLITGVVLWLTAWVLPGFDVTMLGGLVGGIIIAFFNTIITGILDVNEEGSFYQNRIERRAREQPFSGADEPGRGLMMVEIDGLSYWHIKRALDGGLLPTLKEMVENDDYRLTLVDCGLPSMTSACQAGIMFGDNHDIPAYRWYDKSKQKLYVSSSDASELNQRYARGQGLMRGGSSIDNMFDGDAEKSMFTMSNVKSGSPEENKRRADDVSLLMLDPYFLTRALAIFFWELGRELWEAWRQKRHDVQPRLNRLAHFYPFVRAATCTLLRDISTNIAVMDMMRSAPSIYMLYLGYDEVAHHSGPWTEDAFGDLKRLDRTFGRLRQAIKKAPRDYDLLILSDHGQSFGATFKQRYGIDIKTLIEQLMPEGTTVSQSIGGDTGATGLTGLSGELQNVTQSGAGNAFDKALAKQGQKLTSRAASKAIEATAEEMPASVTAYGSGNAAQIYFDLLPRKIKLSELNAAYPGLVTRLVEHEGIGIVFGYEDDETVLAIGKQGTRNLHTGQVLGEDPVAPYAPATGHGAATIDKRVWQMKRVMEFPSAGDLWVISTVYPDGTVAALEELIGSHGGVGGEQTDAFLFHPADMAVPETRSSVDVYHILNSRRGAPVAEKSAPIERSAEDWALATLAKGISQVGTWTAYALRCLLLDRGAYAEVARDPFMTGPALLIAVVGVLLGTLLRGGGFHVVEFVVSLALWLLAAALLYAAGLTLTKKGNFSSTLRAVGFAQVLYVLTPLALLPLIGPPIRILLALALFVSTWIGAAEAHQTRGWRTVLLPVIAFLILGIGYAVVTMLLSGAEFTLSSVFASLGISAP